MAAPNTRFRAVRLGLHMSQVEMAKAVRAAGERAGEPNTCTATNIQRWEAGAMPRGAYLRALEAATGQPAANLGFASERYGVDNAALGIAAEMWLEPQPQSDTAPLNGIWLSRYEYESTGRGAWFINSHYVMVLQQGARLQVRSLPGTTPGRVLMDLTVNGQAITGNWTEETNPGGYYQGAVYHGAVQMLLEPSARKMVGKWAGFGRDFEVNTGPWSLELITHDTSPEAQERYSKPVTDKSPAGDDEPGPQEEATG